MIRAAQVVAALWLFCVVSIGVKELTTTDDERRLKKAQALAWALCITVPQKVSELKEFYDDEKLEGEAIASAMLRYAQGEVSCGEERWFK
jgi:hypothetical protein